MQWALPALIALTVLRLFVAASIPLIPDEAYYWVWSRALAPGYPDHPPMVALWIRLGTILAGDDALGVRLLGPIATAIGSLLLADAANRLFPVEKPGLRAALLLNATLLFGAGTLLMTPDAPLLTFWIAGIWALARLLDSGSSWWWGVVGLFAGLAMVSKYTALLLWSGICIWLLVTPGIRAWLRRPAPWFGAAVAVGVFLPVLLWEATHRWPSFTRQGGRIVVWHPSRAIDYLAELIGGQIGLITPVVFLFCAAGILQATRQAWRTRDPAWTLLMALTLPSVVLFTQHAFGDRVQGNWPAIIYPAAAIAASTLRGSVWQRLRAPGIALGFAITAVVYLHAGLGVFRLPIRLDPIARQLDGWDTLAAEVEAARRETGAEYIAADQYGTVAKLARGLPTGTAVVGVGSRWSLFALPRPRLAGKAGILVHSAGGAIDDISWASATPVATAARRHGSETLEQFVLYRVVGAANPSNAALISRPWPH
ncbi:MAG TPA: glycosyltransferase family 39 protein [Acetobacteraceae bacterium]|jgi:4-amino-4-deoxy-L-arabinose transferase-like glycosyltransferase